MWRYCAFVNTRGVFRLLRNRIFPGSESRARAPVLEQVGLDPAYFQTQCMKQPSCGLQARVGPCEVGSRLRGTSRARTKGERRLRFTPV